MPQEALHIAHFSGDFTACLAFALEECRQRKAARLNCIYPFAAATIQETLQNSGFQNLDGTLIVMEKSEDEVDED